MSVVALMFFENPLNSSLRRVPVNCLWPDFTILASRCARTERHEILHFLLNVGTDGMSHPRVPWHIRAGITHPSEIEISELAR